MDITRFLEDEFVNHASYSTIRGLPSYVDGLKNASRKCVWTMIHRDKSKRARVDMFANQVIDKTKYLHGGCEGTVVSLGVDYVGNPYPLFKKHGFFGNRLTPEASAPRYIEVSWNANLKALFKDDDTPNLTHQVFEGYQIEPIHLMPELPLLILRGANGVSTGFKSAFVPRSIESVIRYIKHGKGELVPSVVGFKGEVLEDPNKAGAFIYNGVVEVKNSVEVFVTELPLGYNLARYVKILTTLKDEDKINSFKDLSNPKTGEFKFSVKFQRSVLKQLNEEKLLKLLKLTTRQSEIYITIDEHNKVFQADSIYQVLDKWIKLKEKFVKLRHKHRISEFEDSMKLVTNKAKFIKLIIEGKIVIAKKKKAEIVNQLASNGIDKRNHSYDYLLHLPLYSISDEMLKKMKAEYDKTKEKLDKLKLVDPIQEWKDTLHPKMIS